MTKSITPAAPRRPAPHSLRDFLAGPPAVSQRALAEAAGCNQSMISMLVRGKRVPSARLAVKLHAITGVALKILLATKMGNRIESTTPKPKGRTAARGDPAQRRPQTRQVSP